VDGDGIPDDQDPDATIVGRNDTADRDSPGISLLAVLGVLAIALRRRRA